MKPSSRMFQPYNVLYPLWAMTVSFALTWAGQIKYIFEVILGRFKQSTICSQIIASAIWQQIYVKNVHPVNSAGIRTHDHRNTSLLPQPLHQDSRIIAWENCFIASVPQVISLNGLVHKIIILMNFGSFLSRTFVFIRLEQYSERGPRSYFCAQTQVVSHKDYLEQILRILTNSERSKS